MNRILKSATCLSVLAVCALTMPTTAQSQSKPAGDGPKETTRFDGPTMDPAAKQKMIENMMAMMQPGPEHKRLERMVGSWNVVTKYWMEPGAPPKSIDGKSRCEMALGGRFLRCELKGEFEGMPFEALNLIGFDRRTDKYTSVAFDTMGTYYVTAEGEYDTATKSIRMHGQTHDPKLNHTEIYTMVWREVSDDQYVQEVWFKPTPEGQAVKVVESTCTRVK